MRGHIYTHAGLTALLDPLCGWTITTIVCISIPHTDKQTTNKPNPQVQAEHEELATVNQTPPPTHPPTQAHQHPRPSSLP